MDKLDYDVIFKKIKIQDFPLECRPMYAWSKMKHEKQKRKGNGKPYFVHPKGVAFLVARCGGTHDQINAALGHDLMEDTDSSYMEIYMAGLKSQHCADLCTELTNNKHIIAEVGKEQYMTDKLLGLSEDALLIKLADMVYNSYDSPAESAINRMYKNVCQLLLKRKLNPKCEELARMVLLADYQGETTNGRHK